ncbi:MAG: hypothetical protein ACR2PZ_23900 [Pseudomonadales bacterium]
MNFSNRIKNLSMIAAAVAVSGAAVAQASSPSQSRGYSKCLNAIAEQSQGLSSERNYLFSRDGAKSQYYINATRQHNGERVAIRINCQTTANGQMLLSHEVAPGRFARKQSQPGVTIADR